MEGMAAERRRIAAGVDPAESVHVTAGAQPGIGHGSVGREDLRRVVQGPGREVARGAEQHRSLRPMGPPGVGGKRLGAVVVTPGAEVHFQDRLVDGESKLARQRLAVGVLGGAMRIVTDRAILGQQRVAPQFLVDGVHAPGSQGAFAFVTGLATGVGRL